MGRDWLGNRMRTVQRPLSELTHVRLKELLHYDPETGIFTWRAPSKYGKTRPGMRAGCVVHTKQADYWVIRPTREFPLTHAHRLAFFYMTGRWPHHTIDHRNRIGTDNRWENLREATQGQNMLNRAPRKSQTPYRGVWKQGNSYAAYITVNKERIRLGSFTNPEAAARAWNVAAVQHHGAFAQLNKIE